MYVCLMYKSGETGSLGLSCFGGALPESHLGVHLKQLLSRPHLNFGFYKPVCVVVTSVLLTLPYHR